MPSLKNSTDPVRCDIAAAPLPTVVFLEEDAVIIKGSSVIQVTITQYGFAQLQKYQQTLHKKRSGIFYKLSLYDPKSARFVAR